MRTALVLTGLPRDFERAAPNIFKNVIDRFSISREDIYFSVWAQRGYWHPGDAAEFKSFTDSGMVSETQIKKLYPGATIDMESFEEEKTQLSGILDGFPEVHIPSLNHSNYLVRGINLVSMLYKIQRGLTLALLDPEVTHIVRTRPDMWLFRKAPRMPSNGLVIAKQSNHLGLGVGDNFHLGPRESHRPIMQALKNLPLLFEQTGGIMCPHQILEAALLASRTPFTQKRIKFQTFHTPGGMYKAKDGEGVWTDAAQIDYDRRSEPFRGLN